MNILHYWPFVCPFPISQIFFLKKYGEEDRKNILLKFSIIYPYYVLSSFSADLFVSSRRYYWVDLVI